MSLDTLQKEIKKLKYNKNKKKIRNKRKKDFRRIFSNFWKNV